MRSLLSLTTLLFILVLAVPTGTAAQGLSGFIFSTYYECDITLEAIVDDALMSNVAPIYDRHVEEGSITEWSWSAHVIGGAWRRLAYFVTPDRASGMAARASILETIQQEAPETAALVNRACPKHDDYIWTVNQSSQVESPTDRAMPFTTGYYICQQAREAEADEAIRAAWAPILEELVKDGKLTGWTWIAHDTGGMFRRAMSLSGSDHTSIMAARDELSNRLSGNNAASALTGACGTHTDYAWRPVGGSGRTN